MIRRPRHARQDPELPTVPYHNCPAKTYVNHLGERCPGRHVFEHCLIVGEVARALILRYPPALRCLFPSGSVLLAAVHDIGKVSPTFLLKW